MEEKGRCFLMCLLTVCSLMFKPPRLTFPTQCRHLAISSGQKCINAELSAHEQVFNLSAKSLHSDSPRMLLYGSLVVLSLLRYNSTPLAKVLLYLCST